MHGDGSYIRSWLHVEDSVEALLAIMERGEPNRIYNVSGDVEYANLKVLHLLADLYNVPRENAIVSVSNRVGQDLRYSMDDSKVRELGWAPRRNFERSLGELADKIDPSRFR